jgi:hypothetical protein
MRIKGSWGYSSVVEHIDSLPSTSNKNVHKIERIYIHIYIYICIYIVGPYECQDENMITIFPSTSSFWQA